MQHRIQLACSHGTKGSSCTLPGPVLRRPLICPAEVLGKHGINGTASTGRRGEHCISRHHLALVCCLSKRRRTRDAAVDDASAGGGGECAITSSAKWSSSSATAYTPRVSCAGGRQWD